MKSELLSADGTLDRIVDRLVSTFHPDGIYLFGSKARGDDGPESDYDLLVVVEDASEPPYKRMQQAQVALWSGDITTAADVFVYTRAEFEAGRKQAVSIPASAVSEGKRLYAA